MSGHTLVALAGLAVGYAVWAYLHPYRPCPKCKGSGQNKGSTQRRWGKCRRCGGTRSVKTFGSQALHRLVRAVRQQSWRK